MVFLVAMALLVGSDFLTLAYWEAYGWHLLQMAFVIWLFLRCVDAIYCLPDRRAAKRHLDAIEKKWGKF